MSYNNYLSSCMLQLLASCGWCLSASYYLFCRSTFMGISYSLSFLLWPPEDYRECLQERTGGTFLLWWAKVEALVCLGWQTVTAYSRAVRWRRQLYYMRVMVLTVGLPPGVATGTSLSFSQSLHLTGSGPGKILCFTNCSLWEMGSHSEGRRFWWVWDFEHYRPS